MENNLCSVFSYAQISREYGAIYIMAFFQSAVGTLQTLVIALGAGLGIWGAINLMKDMVTIIRVQMLMVGKEATIN